MSASDDSVGVAELAIHDEALLDGGASLSALATITFEDSTFSLDVIDSFFSLIASSFPPLVDTFSFPSMEPDIIWDHLLFPSSFPPSLITDTTAFHAVGLSVPHVLHSFDLTKAPSSYSEAIACPDAPAWHAAMDHEHQSLSNMGAFKETDLPSGEKAIGLKWVYDYKTDALGNKIPGKEKARLVAQGFNQWLGQYSETYAPVAKMASVCILLTWAAVHDLEIFQFDCKTAFLHAKLCHNLYARPFPGFAASNPSKVLHILAVLYGLCQSAYEFYILIMSLFLDLGMIQCKVDHGVFIVNGCLLPILQLSCFLLVCLFYMFLCT